MISVIIPVFNTANFLEKAVDSVLIHSCVGELILVDDGSSDGSYELCLDLIKRDKRCRLLTHSERANKGAAESRNIGILAAVFPFISFLDADDSYLPNRFKESLDLLLSDDSLDACFGRVLVFDKIKKTQKQMGFLKKKPEDSVLTYLLKGGYFHTNSITVRNIFFKKVGLFNQKVWPHEDLEMWIRISYLGKIKNLLCDDPIAIYQIHENNLSKFAGWKSRKNFWRQIWRQFRYENVGVFNKYLIIKKLIRFNLQALKSKFSDE